MPVCIRILLFYTGFKSQLKTQGANRTRLSDVLMFIGFIGLTAYNFDCKVIIFKTQGETACRGTFGKPLPKGFMPSKPSI